MFSLEKALRLVPDAHARTYACDCMAYTAVAVVAMQVDEGDERHPALPWRCAGHPGLELPSAVDGVTLAAETDWDRFVADALTGVVLVGWGPPGVATDRHPGAWLARIVLHLDDRALAAALAGRFAAHLLSPDPMRRRAAISFYRHVPGAPGCDALGAALVQHRALFVGVPGGLAPPRDLGNELVECVGVQLGLAPTPALIAAAQAELLGGHGHTAFVLALARLSPAWLACHAGELVRLGAASAGRLRRVLAEHDEAVREQLESSLGGPGRVP